MKREPRGFHYVLEPLRRKSDWELQELRQALAHLNQEVADREQTVAQCQDRLTAASAELAREQGPLRIIHVDQQRTARAYINNQQQRLQLARKALAKSETERDQAAQNLHRLQKFADGLEEHREDAIKDHAHALEKTDIVEADDAWLRSTHWRKAQ